MVMEHFAEAACKGKLPARAGSARFAGRDAAAIRPVGARIFSRAHTLR
jgi:hypothetical protein